MLSLRRRPRARRAAGSRRRARCLKAWRGRCRYSSLSFGFITLVVERSAAASSSHRQSLWLPLPLARLLSSSSVNSPSVLSCVYAPRNPSIEVLLDDARRAEQKPATAEGHQGGIKLLVDPPPSSLLARRASSRLAGSLFSSLPPLPTLHLPSTKHLPLRTLHTR